MRQISGQSIIEVLIATAVVAVLLVSLLILGTNSLKATTYARNLNQATAYSNQVGDWLRNMKESVGWGIFSTTILEDTATSTVTYCLSTLPADATEFRALANQPCTSTDTIPQTIFTRNVILNVDLINGTITATINTTWEANTTRNATIYVTLTQWK